MCYIHMMEHYLVIIRNEELTHAKTWMNLENIALSQRPDTKSHISYDSACMKCQE